MAHKETYNMDDFENKGWNKMNSILDKEMPVTKKRNRVVPFWWTGGIAAALLFAMLFYTNFNNKSSTEKSNIPNHSPAITENKITPETNTNNDINKSNTTADQINPIHSNNNKSSKNKLAKIIPNQSEKSEVLFIPGDLKSKNTDHKIANQDVTETVIPGTIENNYLYNDDKVTSDASRLNNRLLITSSENITSLTLNPFPLLTNKRTIPIPLTTTSKGQWGLQILSNSSNNKGYNELGIGGFRQWDINRRWDMSVGLSYNFRSELYDLTKGTGGDALETADALANSGGGGLTTAVSQDNERDLYQVINQQLNTAQLELPIQLSYRLNNRWSINSNTTASYRFLNQEKYRSAIIDFQVGNPNSQFDNIEIGEIRKWNLHLGTGIAYHINDTWAVNLNYNYLISRKNIASIASPNFDADEWKLSIQYLLD